MMLNDFPDENANMKKLEVAQRYGRPVYIANPSLVGLQHGQKREKKRGVVIGTRQVLFDEDTGELTGSGTVAFLETETVDTESFVKQYLGGMDGVFKLRKAGQTAFRLLWLQINAKKDSDMVALNHYIAADHGIKCSYRVLSNGINELLDNEFIYNTPTQGMYFYNARYMFNGNRIVTAKQYLLKGSPGTEEQQSLPLEESDQ